MRAAIHLHLFYADVALELIELVARLGRADIDVIATFVAPLDPTVDAALDRLPGRVRRELVPNAGWDIGPLFHLLPFFREEGYDAVCHLHTKKGDSGFQEAWRGMAYDGTIAGNDLVTRILAAFEAHPELEIVGSELLYKSAAAHQFKNAEILSAIAPRMLAPTYPLADWGFFAGTFFWTRPRLLERVARVADMDAPQEDRDGTIFHALERLFGLAPVADGGAIGLVGEDGAIQIVAAPGRPSLEPILETLALYHRRRIEPAPVAGDIAAFIAAHNPLVHYIRTGREADALDPNPDFSTRWYNRVNLDVAEEGMHPLHHYILHGRAEGRAAGPEAPSAARAHEAEAGAAEPGLRRFYRHFDIAEEAAFLRGIADLPDDIRAKAAATRVSVIMPAYNREGTIAASIRSVLAQTHSDWELIVVDDGSTDATRAAVEPFLADPRVRLVAGEHQGVSAARNLGLAHATGNLVAYLDSDNRWNSWFLEVMTRFLVSSGLEAGYSAIALRDDSSQLTGYRGAPFDWDEVLRQNYIDLNVLCHRRSLIEEVGGFDPRIRRMVDWDLILRIGKEREIGYAPFVGCDYMDGRHSGRITTIQPAAFQRLVWTKNRYGVEVGSAEFLANFRLVIGIKIHAPEEGKEAWGDWHFAESLAEAIRRLGHDVQIDFRGQWYRRSLGEEDVAIVLRGLEAYQPQRGQLSLLWVISHPDQVSFDEYESYSRVYVASQSFADFLQPLITPPVAALLQATDPERFHPIDGAGEGPPVLFCGNSRGVERPIVNWAIEADRPPAIYGGGWDGMVPPWLVKGRTIDNRELGGRYARAGVVLNDHWPSMAAFGLLSNRLFDIVAAGGKAISDRVPSIETVFGSAVAQVSSPDELREAVDGWREASPPLEAAQSVLEHHSFDARARRLIGDAYAVLGLDPGFAVPAAPPPLPSVRARPAPVRVHAFIPRGGFGPQSSAYVRVLAPLTDESVAHRVAFSWGWAEDGFPDCEVFLVQRTALASVEAAEALHARAQAIGAKIVVDLDDAFIAIGPDHPEAAVYQPLNAALERIMTLASESWFSTAPLADMYAGVTPNRVVIRNGLDPRFWRDWRHARPEPLVRNHVRMLYMGTSTHGPDLAMIRPALDRLAAERPGRFDLTLIGVAADVGPANWLLRHSPPPNSINYSRFSRWLRAQGPYDIGLAPLVDSEFNRAKSDIKLLDYAALGIVAVASDVPAYRTDAALAEKVFLATDWYTTLSAVLDDREAARAKAAAAHEHLWAERSVAAVGNRMVERLEALR